MGRHCFLKTDMVQKKWLHGLNNRCCHKLAVCKFSRVKNGRKGNLWCLEALVFSVSKPYINHFVWLRSWQSFNHSLMIMGKLQLKILRADWRRFDFRQGIVSVCNSEWGGYRAWLSSSFSNTISLWLQRVFSICPRLHIPPVLPDGSVATHWKPVPST